MGVEVEKIDLRSNSVEAGILLLILSRYARKEGISEDQAAGDPIQVDAHAEPKKIIAGRVFTVRVVRELRRH